MNEPALLAAMDVLAMLFWTLRVVAGVGAALVGWFATGGLVRVLYRGAFQRPVPRWLLPPARLAGAVLLGLLVFYYLPLGGGGGLGWGPGAGGGPGLGPGDGSGKMAGEKAAGDKTTSLDEPGSVKPPKKGTQSLEIEVIGGARYKNDERFYLLQRKEPAVALQDVEDFLKKDRDLLDENVTIVLTPESVDALHPAVLRLRTIIERNGFRAQVKDVDQGP